MKRLLLIMLVFGFFVGQETHAEVTCPWQMDSPSSYVYFQMVCTDSVTRRFTPDFPAHALSRFSLEFPGGNHKLNAIGTGIVTPAVRNLLRSRGLDPHPVLRPRPRWPLFAIMKDDDGNDPARVDNDWVPMSAGALLETTPRNCSGLCRVSIQPVPTGMKFALTGFFLVRNNKFNAPVRKLSVWPEGATNFVRVEFGDNDGRETFAAIIQYTFIPRRAIVADLPTQNRSYRGNGSPAEYQAAMRAQRPVPLRGNQVGILQGFSFEFLNGEHFIGQVEANVGASEVRVRFRDGDNDNDGRDDPMGWSTKTLVVDRNVLLGR